MKIKPVKTAVIGCGMISDKYLVNLCNRFSVIDLVGCSDLVPEKSAEKAQKYGIRQMTNEEILNDKNIELVLNLTYPSAHFEVSRQILAAGKHCYSEKMMALSLEEANELDALRQKNGVYFAVAPDTFLGASQQTARMIVDKGLIGEPFLATVNLARGYHMIKSSADDAARKYSVMRPGGGIPYDMGGYYLHELFNIAGPAESVCGYSYTHNPNRPYLNPRHDLFDEDFLVETPNTVCASLRFHSGLLCNFSMTSDCSLTSQRFVIEGTQGMLTLGDPNDFGGPVYLNKNGEKKEFPLSHPFSDESRGIGAADMAYAIRTGRPPRLSFEMGYHALEIINGIKQSDEQGIRLSFTTDFERPVPVSTEYYGGSSEERSLWEYTK